MSSSAWRQTEVVLDRSDTRFEIGVMGTGDLRDSVQVFVDVAQLFLDVGEPSVRVLAQLIQPKVGLFETDVYVCPESGELLADWLESGESLLDVLEDSQRETWNV